MSLETAIQNLADAINNAAIAFHPVAAPQVSAAPAVEPVKVEPVKVEPVKVEPVKVEPVKVEPVKVEPVKVEPAPPVEVKKRAKPAPKPEPLVESEPEQAFEELLEEIDESFEESEPEAFQLPAGERNAAFYAAHVQPVLQQLGAKDKPALANLIRVVFSAQKGNLIPVDQWDDLVNHANILLAA